MGIIIEFGNLSANDSFVSRRLAIGVAVLIAFLIHVGFQFLAYFASAQKIHKHRIDHLSKKLYLYLIVCLISYNYLQGNIFNVLLAWITLIAVIALHFTTIKSFDKPDLEPKLWLIYYTLNWVHFFGLIIGFYTI